MATPITIRDVWETNLDEEFKLINQCLGEFRFASFDTEFPGTVYHANIPTHVLSKFTASQLYFLMKQNVDDTKLIQFGLTLSDVHGNLPRLGTESHYVWQFNFRDFDCDNDLHNPESIALLKRQGIDFQENKTKGINSHIFAALFKYYGLARPGKLTWITFHGLYDYGYMIKILTAQRLPDRFQEYVRLVHYYFGFAVYDLKPMTRALGLHGGLEKIAERLNLGRAAGKSHQAGSDSLLNMQVFMRLRENYPTRHMVNGGWPTTRFVSASVPVVRPRVIFVPCLR